MFIFILGFRFIWQDVENNISIFWPFFRVGIVEGINCTNTSFWNTKQFVSSLKAYNLYTDLSLKMYHIYFIL